MLQTNLDLYFLTPTKLKAFKRFCVSNGIKPMKTPLFLHEVNTKILAHISSTNFLLICDYLSFIAVCDYLIGVVTIDLLVMKAKCLDSIFFSRPTVLLRLPTTEFNFPQILLITEQQVKGLAMSFERCEICCATFPF